MKSLSVVATFCFLVLSCAVGATAASADSPAAAPADTVLGPGPGEYRIESGGHSVRIPFEMFGSDIRMDALVNGRPARLLVDNGHLWDPLLFFGSTRVDSLELPREPGREVTGGGEGDAVDADHSSNVSVDFGGITFTGQDAVITHYDPELPNLWAGAEGQVSSAFFKHFVTEIDFETGEITLTEPEHYRYEGDGVVLPLIPLPDDAWAIPGEIELEDGRVIAADLMMDLGYGRMLSIVVGGPHGVQPPSRSIEAVLGYGIQGPIRGHHGRVRSLTVGGHRLDEPLVAFEETEDFQPYTEIMVGMEVFRRFHVVFDYPGRRLILEPNRDFGRPEEFDMSGLFLRPVSGGGRRVTRVLPDSPAAEAGIVVGDVITRLGGRPCGQVGFWELRRLMRREGERIALTITREGRDFEVAIVLRRLI